MAPTMLALRSFMHRHRGVALLIVMLALCLKAVLPGGYMIEQSSKTINVTICHSGAGLAQTAQIAIPMKQGGDPAGAKLPKAECPYSALTMAATGGADGVLLLAALAYILLLGFAPARSAIPAGPSYLRPFLRGPPARA